MVGSPAEVACWMLTGQRQSARIRAKFLRAILRQDVAFFDTETSTGDVIARMSGDIVLVQEGMGEKVRGHILEQNQPTYKQTVKLTNPSGNSNSNQRTIRSAD